MNSFLYKIYFGNSVQDWLVALGIVVITAISARIFKRVILARITAVAKRTTSTLDDFLVRLIQRTLMPVAYVTGFYLATRYLVLPTRIETIVHAAITVIAVFYIIRGITDLVAYSFQRFTNRHESGAKQAKGILLIIKVTLWILGLVFLLDNFGYDITTIVAGLGIGGIAIALAAQAVLADLFSYLVIFFDKPFEDGDFIVVGDKSGIVEYIGIKTTRLRTLGGEQLIMSNTDLTNSRVQNFKRMEKRRVLLSIGVTYETSPEQLRRIPEIIREIVEAKEGVQFERTHFTGFGDSSLDFEIVYHILTADYMKFMDIQQAFCLEVFEQFNNEGIEFAYPTQKLFLEGKIKEEFERMDEHR